MQSKQVQQQDTDLLEMPEGTPDTNIGDKPDGLFGDVPDTDDVCLDEAEAALGADGPGGDEDDGDDDGDDEAQDPLGVFTDDTKGESTVTDSSDASGDNECND